MLGNIKQRFWAWVIRKLAEDPAQCDHKWDVVCGITSSVSLQVQCQKCATWGAVADPTKEEWDACFDAYENPYPWDDSSRVDFTLQPPE